MWWRCGVVYKRALALNCTSMSQTRSRQTSVRIIMLVFFLSAVLVVVAACPPCDNSTCPEEPERHCPLGAVPDPCLCCPLGVCGLEEDQLCYNASIFKDSPDKRRLGVCATNMICVLRKDLKPSDGLAAACQCADQRIACGSNNRTYETTCAMNKVENNKRVFLQYWGPCRHEPQVTSAPEAVNSLVGHPIVLACEAKGFPVPFIAWEFIGSGGDLVTLPGDDQSISVQLRGGPEALMVSSWVQISQARIKDSGTYSCLANNSHGTARSTASVLIKSSQL